MHHSKNTRDVKSLLTCWKSLLYYFIRSLIHRPAVCFGEDHVRSPSVLALADSGKHIVQIVELLDERRLSLSFSINRRELISASGIGLLWQNIGLKRDSKLVKESQKVLTTVIDQLEAESSVAAAEFSALATVLVSLDNKHSSTAQPQSMSPPMQKPLKSPKKQLEAWKARLMGNTSPNNNSQQKAESVSRRNTVSGSSPGFVERQLRSPSWASLPPDNVQHTPMGKDFYNPALGYDTNPPMSCSVPTDGPTGNMSMSDWEFVVSDMDQGFSNIFTGIYGGKECGEDPGPFASLTAEYMNKQGQAMPPLSTSSGELQGLSPEAWSATSSSDVPHQRELATQSVYSDESLGSRDDSLLPNLPFALEERNGSILDPLQGVIIPTGDNEIDEFGLVNGWDRRLAV